MRFFPTPPCTFGVWLTDMRADILLWLRYTDIDAYIDWFRALVFSRWFSVLHGTAALEGAHVLLCL